MRSVFWILRKSLPWKWNNQKPMKFIYLLLVVVLFSCNNKLARTLHGDAFRISRLIRDSTLYFDKELTTPASANKKQAHYHLELSSMQRSTSLAKDVNRIDSMLLRHFSYLPQFKYRLYSISDYRIENRESIITKTHIAVLKTADTTVIELNPPDMGITSRNRRLINR